MKTKNLLYQSDAKPYPEFIYEIGITYKRPAFEQMDAITSCTDVENLAREILDPDTLDVKEHMWVVLLTHSNRVLGIAEIGRGCVGHTAVNILEIFQLCLLTNAASIVLLHNHPSGTLKPSSSDLKLTNKVMEICDLSSIKLLDHIIITSEDAYSFRNQGHIPDEVSHLVKHN